jgi:hypothetical protein
MGYLNEFSKELESKIIALEKIWREGDVSQCDEEISGVVKFVSDKLLESYRNGRESTRIKPGRIGFRQRGWTSPPKESRRYTS